LVTVPAVGDTGACHVNGAFAPTDASAGNRSCLSAVSGRLFIGAYPFDEFAADEGDGEDAGE
jgi:hypothetical protein